MKRFCVTPMEKVGLSAVIQNGYYEIRFSIGRKTATMRCETKAIAKEMLRRLEGYTRLCPTMLDEDDEYNEQAS